MIPQTRRSIPEDRQAPGVLVRKRSQQERAHHAENGAVGAHTDGQGDHGGGRKDRRSGKCAQRISNVLRKCLHGCVSSVLMTSPVAPPLSAEPEARKTRPTLAAPFRPDQLQAHAAALASGSSSHPIPTVGGHSCRASTRAPSASIGRTGFSPRSRARILQPVGSEDWLRDNYHVVQDQVREIRQDLPRQYYFELPKLAAGPAEGYPRVYRIARELVSHTAGRLDLDTIVDFVAAYQTVAPLGDRGDLGDSHHAAARARRGAAAPGRQHSLRPSEPGTCPSMGSALGGRRSGTANRPSAGRGAEGEPPPVGGLRRRAAAMAARPAVIGCARLDCPAARARRAGRLGRGAGQGRAAAGGRRSARDRERHHEHAAAVVDRLAGLLRPRQPGRADAAKGPGWRLCLDGLLHARPLSPLDRAAGEAGQEG